MRRTIVPAVTLLLALAAGAHAEPGREGRVAASLHLLGGTTPYPGLYGGMSQAVLGAGAGVDLPVGDSHHWTCSPFVGYGRGHWTNTISGSITDRDEYDVEVWEGSVDFLHHSALGDDADLYWGPGAFMDEAHFTHRQPQITSRSEPYDTFGIELRVGGGIPLGGRWELTGDACPRMGWSHYELASGTVTSELSNLTFSQVLRIGTRVRF